MHNFSYSLFISLAITFIRCTDDEFDDAEGSHKSGYSLENHESTDSYYKNNNNNLNNNNNNNKNRESNYYDNKLDFHKKQHR